MADSTESQQLLLPNTDQATALATPIQMRPDDMSHQYQHSHQSTQPVDSHSQNTATHTKIPQKPLDPDVAAQQVSLQPTLHIGSTRGSGWAWEYAALALSAGAVTALVTLLAYINNSPLSHWTLLISPTTAISILAAVARASLGFAISSCLGQAKWNWFRKRSDAILAFDRFDDASRGPWGSFWLIIWVRAYHSVAIGAAVTIILLAFEPFFQAILSFDGSIASSEPALAARIGRSEVFDAGTYFTYHDPVTTMMLPSNETIVLDGYTSRPDLGMVSALNSGFYNISGVKTQTASFACPTANCTWSPFTTLAICTTCNIVTDHLKRKKKEGENLGGLPYHGAGLYTNWTINSLPDLNLTNISWEKAVIGGSNLLQSQLLAATRLSNLQHTISFKNLTNMITTVQILKAAEGYIEGDAIWDDTSVTATECALYFCVNAYKSSVKQGELEEEIIASWSERDPTSYAGLKISPSTPTPEFDKWNNYSLYSGDYDVDRTNLQLLIPPGDTQRFDLPENVTTRFTLTQTAVGSTGRFLNTEFFGDQMAWPLRGETADKMPPVVQALYQSTNLSATFEMVAQSMTKWIRDTSNSSSEIGIAQEWTIRIHVEWPYIAAPLAAFAAGLVFCLYSIFETRKLGLEPWKTNAIPTLTHSVDTETRAQLRHAYRQGYLDKAVRTMVVTYEDVGNGLELKIKQS
ncbi:hypothetical protein F4803DRAFT_546361 [Xylaria telfairii]|nr:hypothetical protein F4803DRAFT_546361 [Xylaria telfairii]